MEVFQIKSEQMKKLVLLVDLLGCRHGHAGQARQKAAALREKRDVIGRDVNVVFAGRGGRRFGGRRGARQFLSGLKTNNIHLKYMLLYEPFCNCQLQDRIGYGQNFSRVIVLAHRLAFSGHPSRRPRPLICSRFENAGVCPC